MRAQPADTAGQPRPAGRSRARRRGLLTTLREDVSVVLEKDPAVTSWREALLYPHLQALWLHRIAHLLYRRRLWMLARAVALYARTRTGIDIHPGTAIGRRLFIDHGAAVVIGETAVIHDDVMLYHNVTLGSIGWWKDVQRPRGARRHPIVETGAVIGTGASVLGPVTIGAGARIGAHALVLDDVPPGGRVTQPPTRLGADHQPRLAPPPAGPAEPPPLPSSRTPDFAAKGASQ